MSTQNASILPGEPNPWKPSCTLGLTDNTSALLPGDTGIPSMCTCFAQSQSTDYVHTFGCAFYLSVDKGPRYKTGK